MRTDPEPSDLDEKIALYLAKARAARNRAQLARRWDERESWEELGRSWEALAEKLREGRPAVGENGDGE